MIPQVVVLVVGVVVCLQVIFLIRNTSPVQAITRPVFDPPPRINHEELQAVLNPISQPFPRKIWQTSKNGPAGLDDGDKEAVRTWTKLNQKWRYEQITQYSAESYLRESFPDRPEIIEIFVDLQDPILRADMIRYLVLLKDGGLYSDLDTKSLKPIEDWIPTQFRAETNVVIGVEYDKLQGDPWPSWTLNLQFTSWAILAKPQHPLLEHVVQKVMRSLRDLALEQDVSIAKLHPSYYQVLDTTGPAAFTRGVFEYLSLQLGEEYTWENVTDLKAPILVEDVLILPVTAFGCGQEHSNSHGEDDPTALVHHLFRGSWKDDHNSEPQHHNDDEEERRRQEEEDKKKQEEEDRKKQEEEDKNKQEEADRKKQEEEDRKKQEDEDKKKQADEDKKKQEEEDKKNASAEEELAHSREHKPKHKNPRPIPGEELTIDAEVDRPKDAEDQAADAWNGGTG